MTTPLTTFFVLLREMLLSYWKQPKREKKEGARERRAVEKMKKTKRGLPATPLIGTTVLLSISSEGKKKCVFGEEMNSTTGYFRCQRKHPTTTGGREREMKFPDLFSSFLRLCPPNPLIWSTANTNQPPICLIPKKCVPLIPAYANYLRYVLCFENIYNSQ